MARGVLAVSIGLVIFSALHLASVAGEPNSAKHAAHLDAAIDRLSAPTYLEREIAASELLHQGSTATGRLEAALPSAKGETRYRIRSILARQRSSSDNTTRRAAEQALVRIAAGKDRASAAWAKSVLNPSSQPIVPPVNASSPGA